MRAWTEAELRLQLHFLLRKLQYLRESRSYIVSYGYYFSTYISHPLYIYRSVVVVVKRINFSSPIGKGACSKTRHGAINKSRGVPSSSDKWYCQQHPHRHHCDCSRKASTAVAPPTTTATTDTATTTTVATYCSTPYQRRKEYSRQVHQLVMHTWYLVQCRLVYQRLQQDLRRRHQFNKLLRPHQPLQLRQLHQIHKFHHLHQPHPLHRLHYLPQPSEPHQLQLEHQLQ